jgi:hypothetical protein
MRISAMLGICMATAACNGGAPPRRWDTSQSVIKFPSAGVVAVATPSRWAQGIQSDYMREFLDEFDAAADSLERSGFLVAETFRDTIRIVNWPDSVTIVRPVAGQTDGYYLVAPRRAPRFVPGSLKARELMKVLRGWLADTPRVAVAPATLDTGGPPFALLSPDSIPGLPAAVRAELNRRDCLIPQEHENPRPNNIVRGSFGAVGQVDWAARCWRDQRSTILVVWGGRAWCPETMHERPDPLSSWMLTHGRGFYDAALVRADSTRIANIEVYGPDELAADSVGDTPAAAWRGYDGIEDIILEKGSVVWYCLRGRWVSLGGGD